MNLHAIDDESQPFDIIVGGSGNQVTVELDVRNNNQVKIGDRYVAEGEDYLTILQVVNIEFSNNYDNFTARQTNAMREGVVGVPKTRPVQEAFQRKLAKMVVEGELHSDGRQTIGARRLPERLTPVRPIPNEILVQFSTTPNGNGVLGLLRSADQVINRVARIAHNFAGDRLIALGTPGSGKSQQIRGILAQLMGEQAKTPLGVLVLDRAGEYIEDTQSQDGHTVYGLQNHPAASKHLVIVSQRPRFKVWAQESKIAAYLTPLFNLADIEPIDLVDFYHNFTPSQRNLLRDYVQEPDLYQKLLRETKLGQIDKSHWYQDFRGLFELRKEGKQLLHHFEEVAEEGDELTDTQIEELQEYLGGSKAQVMERLILGIKRFAQNPFFGGQKRAKAIHNVQSCVGEVINHLAQGRTVVIDLRGVDDDNYTLISALFARRLLNENKRRDDADQLRCCLVMEEAHNILAESELLKGRGQGSVFVEMAREGRKLKLGFILVTQQPDPNSIAVEIAWTIDTVIAFHMPLDNIRYLSRLKSSFSQFEYILANASPFEGVAVSNTRATLFRATPILPEYMQACGEQELDAYLESLAPAGDTQAQSEVGVEEENISAEDRLTKLLRERNCAFQEAMRATMAAWRET